MNVPRRRCSAPRKPSPSPGTPRSHYSIIAISIIQRLLLSLLLIVSLLLSLILLLLLLLLLLSLSRSEDEYREAVSLAFSAELHAKLYRPELALDAADEALAMFKEITCVCVYICMYVYIYIYINIIIIIIIIMISISIISIRINCISIHDHCYCYYWYQEIGNEGGEDYANSVLEVILGASAKPKKKEEIGAMQRDPTPQKSDSIFLFIDFRLQ